jgi:hypothetical protein
MDKVYYSLDFREDNRLTRVFRVIFGFLCVAIAIYWLVFNLRTGGHVGTQWITVAFLLGFGAFQIYSGLGFAGNFIEISNEKIRLRKNSILPVTEFTAARVEKIELFPLNVIFFLKSGGKKRLRFGISDPDKVENIKKGIVEFAELQNIRLDVINEEI